MNSRVVIVHSEKAVRHCLETLCQAHRQVDTTGDLKAGLKMILKVKPALVVAGLEPIRKEALVLLRYMKEYGSTSPMLVVGGRGAGALQAAAMKAGAKAFVEYPIDQTGFDREVSKVLQADVDAHDAIPPVTDEEEGVNLTVLEHQLNRRMKCPSGKNQVHLQSLIVGLRKTRPRISLKCPLRAEFSMKPNVYYEYIRDVCCGDPSGCPAVQQFQARNTA